MPVATGATATEANLNDTTPAAPVGTANGKWLAGAPYADPNNPAAQVRDISVSYKVPYNIHCQFLAAPTAAQEVFWMNTPMVTGAVGDKIALPVGLPGSTFKCKVAPTGSISLTIKVNGVAVGTADMAASATVGTFTWTALVTMNAGDDLEIFAPAIADATFSTFTMTLVGYRA